MYTLDVKPKETYPSIQQSNSPTPVSYGSKVQGLN
jgi:hypothetical protein